ncbi:MAG TPA: FCD domain-containing protein, partial [Syntrophorhabdaceae bacterium]|nr:FCD domain-containing protein [Syntrophorhabdaceae bacterium]
TEQRLAITRRDLHAYVELDAQFHELNSFFSGSDRILDMNRTLMQHMLRFRTQALYMIETASKSFRGHEKILQAIEHGDAESAVAMLEEHLNSARDDILYYEINKSEQMSNA